MRIGLVTLAHGRHDHLRRQEESLRRSRRRPDVRVVVAMDDPQVRGVVDPGTVVVDCPPGTYGLPLARARNRGAETAIDAGADLLVLLDVDCLVGPTTLDAYAGAAADPTTAGDLLTGATGYLPETTTPYALESLPDARFHEARPRPAPGTSVREVEPTLFWSLSFAARSTTWRRIGGFDEAYEGYGGEDTDFGLRASAAGVGLTFVGGAETWHQWHPTGSDDEDRLDDLLRNGAVFADRWGWWPMHGWFERLAARGLVERSGPGWRRTHPVLPR